MGEEKIAVSVIIPVYNAGKTIRQTLDSLLNQSLRNIEIICVDDGSTDDSLDILREYATRDERVIFLRQQNQYAGVARNNGMARARGEWLFFLDADDYVLEYGMEAAYRKCVKYDLDCLKFRSLTFDTGRNCYVATQRNDFTRLKDGDYLRLVTLIPGSPLLKVSVAPWSGFFRREYIQRRGIQFNSLRCVNDRSFYARVISREGRFMCSQDRVTVHRVNQQESLVGQKSKYFECQIQSLTIVERQLREDGVEEKPAELIMREEYQDMLGWYAKYAEDPERRAEMDRQIESYLKDSGTAYKDLFRILRENRVGKADRLLPPETHPLRDAAERPKVSVVVPVANAADHLNLALEALARQTLGDMEFILVNNGSTDHSLTILREYAELDRRFVVIDQPCTGYGQAMNRGLDAARGEYLGMLDPGDIPEPEMFARLYREARAHDLDLVKSDFNRFWVNPDGTYRFRESPLSTDSKFYHRTFSPEEERAVFYFNISNWSGIYRLRFLREHGIRYHESPGEAFQDNGFWFQVFCQAQRVRLLREVLYHQRQAPPEAAVIPREKEGCMTEEFRWMRAWLDGKPELREKYGKILYNKQMLSMMLTWSRAEGARKLPYLRHMKEELQQPYDQGLFDRNDLSPGQWARLDAMMADPEAYMAEVDVSVIIPVYNAEEYLEECLHSVLSRGYARLEMICVDDGSTDGSRGILERFAAEDPRVRIYDSPGKGAGAARNEGLRHARGEYLSFLDADDFFETDMLDKTLSRARRRKLDILVFSSDNFNMLHQRFSGVQGVRTELKPAKQTFAGTEVPVDIFRLFVGWAWDKLFRTEFIRDLGIGFAEIQSSNDLSFVFTALCAAKRVETLEPQPLAHHRRYQGSISTSREESWECYYLALAALRENLIRLGLFERFEQDFVNYALYFTLWQMTTVSGEAYEQIYDRFRAEWARDLGIAGKPKEYFYDPENYRLYQDLKRLEAVPFALYAMNRYRNQATAQAAMAEAGNPAILNSASFRIGRAMTWLPRKVRGGVRMMRESGWRKTAARGKEVVAGLIHRGG